LRRARAWLGNDTFRDGILPWPRANCQSRFPRNSGAGNGEQKAAVRQSLNAVNGVREAGLRRCARRAGIGPIFQHEYQRRELASSFSGFSARFFEKRACDSNSSRSRCDRNTECNALVYQCGTQWNTIQHNSTQFTTHIVKKKT
jgi:hypothetical protein